PATMTSAEPASRASCPCMTAFMPDPQTLLMVVQPAETGRPAPRAAWRAGAWPTPAGSTQPMMTSETSAPSTPASATAALMAAAPSSGDLTGANWPWKEPMAVRRAETMTMESVMGQIRGYEN